MLKYVVEISSNGVFLLCMLSFMRGSFAFWIISDVLLIQSCADCVSSYQLWFVQIVVNEYVNIFLVFIAVAFHCFYTSGRIKILQRLLNCFLLFGFAGVCCNFRYLTEDYIQFEFSNTCHEQQALDTQKCHILQHMIHVYARSRRSGSVFLAWEDTGRFRESFPTYAFSVFF